MTEPVNTVDIIVAGLEHARHGFASLADGLDQRGVKTLFYSQGVGGTASRKYAIRNVMAPRNWLADMVMFFRLLKKHRPRHVEIYLHYGGGLFAIRNVHSIGHVLLTAVMRIPIVLFCTGGEILYWEQHRWLRKVAVRTAFARAKVVVIKELYMLDHISKYRIGDPDKTVFIHNHITVGEKCNIDRHGRTVLFLNSFKQWRNVDLIVEAAALVLKDCPEAQFSLVGARNTGESAPIEDLINRLGIAESVKVHGWVDDGTSYYESASVFVLPADIVFCNNSLLEAMERGTPPIVADVPGAERIVAQGESGLRVPRTAKDLADAILHLLCDESLRRRLGEGARRKIIEEFSECHRAELLLDVYKSKVW